MSKRKLVGVFAGTMLTIIAILASAPASCQDSAGGNEYWIIIDKPLDSEVRDWKPEFRGPKGKVLERLSLKPGDTVRVKVAGVNELLYELRATLVVKPVPPSTGGLDYFMGKFGEVPSFLTKEQAIMEPGVLPAPPDFSRQIKNMRELPTHLVATMVTREIKWQKNDPARPGENDSQGSWVKKLRDECETRVVAATDGKHPSVDNIVSTGAELVTKAAVEDKIDFSKRVTMAARIFNAVLNTKGDIESGRMVIPEGNADCDVKVTLVPVADVEGEPLTYYENVEEIGEGELHWIPTNIKPGDLATREKTFSASQGERKPPSGTAGVIFTGVRDGSYGIEEQSVTVDGTTTTKNVIVNSGDTDAVTLAVGYLHHFKWRESYVSIGVGTGQQSLSYFLGLSKCFGSEERPAFVSLGVGLAQVLRLNQVNLEQEFNGTVVPTKKVYRSGLAAAFSIQF